MSLRRQLGNALFGIKDRLGLYRLKDSSGSVAVLMYHGLETETHRLRVRPLDMHPQHCLDEILFFIKQGYQVIAPSQLEEAERDVNYLIVSFDDGSNSSHKCNF